ncbi:unnamed protein product [Arctogadus glacialis]
MGSLLIRLASFYGGEEEQEEEESEISQHDSSEEEEEMLESSSDESVGLGEREEEGHGGCHEGPEDQESLVSSVTLSLPPRSVSDRLSISSETVHPYISSSSNLLESCNAYATEDG